MFASALMMFSFNIAFGGLPMTRPIAPGVNMPIVAMGTPKPKGSTCCGGGGRAVNHTCCDLAMREAALTWWQAGGVAIETSLAYGTGIGLGAAFAASGKHRDSVFIHGKVQCQSTVDAVAEEIDQHLKEVGIGSFDLLTIHYPNGANYSGHSLLPGCNGKNLSATWSAFEAAKSAGKTKAIGVSDFNFEWLSRLLALGRSAPAYNQQRMEIGQSNLSPELVRLCERNNITIGGFSSMSHGCPSLPLVKKVAAAHPGKTPYDVCMRWVTQQGCNLVVSSSTKDHDIDDLNTVQFTLNDADMKELSSRIPIMPINSARPGLEWARESRVYVSI